MQAVETVKPKNELVDLDKIKKLCEQKNLSFAELGRRLGFEWRDQLSMRLKNRYTISADEIFLIADELGVPTDELRLSQ